ncbi:hypothetical protein C0992_004409 [Termitomyces sp. T32_za158]|nr:hypothetical protein C0992_004409 [Termitomyces sp. T32_za158]
MSLQHSYSTGLGTTRRRSPDPQLPSSPINRAPSPAISISDKVDQALVSQSVRHADIWFHDGSVICRAERTLFKVHMSVLERHSAFFRDMFSMPQPRTGTDVISNQGMQDDIEELPIVDLHDTAEDVGNLLTAVYDGPVFGNNDQEDFRVVSGVLRLSTKYLIDSLRAKALTHLNKAWPASLKEWDAREDLARTHETDLTNSSHPYPHPIAVINLAREVDAPSLLPAAFYDLSRYAFSHIFEPTEEDKTYRPLPPVLSTLSNADLERLCLVLKVFGRLN